MSATGPTAALHEQIPLTKTLGIEVITSGIDAVELALGWAPELCTANGVLHGGVLMALADNAGAVCAFSNLPDGAIGTATIESKTNFLRAVTSGTVVARARTIHVGSTTIVVETELVVEDRLVAKVTQTQAILRPRNPPA